MMNFLRSLAPSANSASHAVPLLPSRFSAEQPLRTAPSAPATRDIEEPRTADGASEAPVHSGLERLITAPQQPPAHTERGGEPHSESRPLRRREPTSGEHTDSADSMNRMPTPRRADAKEDATPPSLHHANPGRDARPASSPAVLPPKLPDRARTKDATPLLRHTQPTVLPSPVVAPLSTAAVAARSSSRADARPAVHVTIDRIEVRAPAPPSRPGTPAPKRTREARVSLSEYLRNAPGRPEARR